MFKIRSIDSLDALKMTIQCEMDMKKFYQKAATLVKNDDAEAILKALARKREKHRHELITIYSKTSGKKILYLNLGRKHKFNILQKCDDDPNEAVRRAKRNEIEIKLFYLTVSRRLMEAELRQFFRELVLDVEQNLALLESSFVEPLRLDQESIEDNTRVLNELTSAKENHIEIW